MTSPIVDLITSDASDLILGSLFASQWGVYQDGVPVIEPATSIVSRLVSKLGPLRALASAIGPNIVPVAASTVDFEFSQEWPISNYPQEEGAFQAYDKVTMPFDIKLKLAAGGPPAVRQAFLSTCLAIANSIDLFDIVTPELTFINCSCTHIDWPRRSDSGVSLIKVDLWFKKVPISSTNIFTNTQQPGESAQQSLGNVQAAVPSSKIQQVVASAGVQ